MKTLIAVDLAQPHHN